MIDIESQVADVVTPEEIVGMAIEDNGNDKLATLHQVVADTQKLTPRQQLEALDALGANAESGMTKEEIRLLKRDLVLAVAAEGFGRGATRRAYKMIPINSFR